MADKINLHDAEILGLVHSKDKNEVCLSVQKEFGERLNLRFFEVLDFYFTPFSEEQNVLFSFEIIENRAKKERWCRENELTKELTASVLEECFTIYEFDSSVGMDGDILAKRMEVEWPSEEVIHMNK